LEWLKSFAFRRRTICHAGERRAVICASVALPRIGAGGSEIPRADIGRSQFHAEKLLEMADALL